MIFNNCHLCDELHTVYKFIRKVHECAQLTCLAPALSALTEKLKACLTWWWHLNRSTAVPQWAPSNPIVNHLAQFCWPCVLQPLCSLSGGLHHRTITSTYNTDTMYIWPNYFWIVSIHATISFSFQLSASVLHRCLFQLENRPLPTPTDNFRCSPPPPPPFSLYELICCYKSLDASGPQYLSDLLHLYTPSRQLRSSADTRIFRIPTIRTETFGQRTFSYQAPVIWSQLPYSLRHPPSLRSFKTNLKTHLFPS